MERTVLITTSLCKTAHLGWIASHYEFAPHRFTAGHLIWSPGFHRPRSEVAVLCRQSRRQVDKTGRSPTRYQLLINVGVA
jgi:hypothetical protein